MKLSQAVVIASALVAAATAEAATNHIFASTATPAVPDVNDTSGVELGIKFTSDVDGTVAGVRFYKGGTTNGGVHYGHLWTTSGTKLAEVQFTGETSSGWQDVTFSPPVAITAGTTYIVSYYCPQGHYSATNGGLSSAVDNAPLHSIADSVSSDGVYLYTTNSTGGFPTSTFQATNYWVDVDFVPGVRTILQSAVPVHGDSGDASAVTLGVKFQSSSNGYITGVRFYKGGTGNGGTHVGQLYSSSGTLLAQATFASETASGWQGVAFSSGVAITAGTTYVASYFAPQGHYSYDSGSDPKGLANAITNAPLTAPSSSSSGGNGLYVYGSSAAFPTQTFNANDYWVDVFFSSINTPPDVTPADRQRHQPDQRRERLRHRLRHRQRLRRLGGLVGAVFPRRQRPGQPHHRPALHVQLEHDHRRQRLAHADRRRHGYQRQRRHLGDHRSHRAKHPAAAPRRAWVRPHPRPDRPRQRVH